MMRRICRLLAVLACLSGTSCAGDIRTGNVGPTGPRQVALAAPVAATRPALGPDYDPLIAGDQILVEIVDSATPDVPWSRTLTVTDGGDLSLPSIGIVHVYGNTEVGAAQEIAEAYHKAPVQTAGPLRVSVRRVAIGSNRTAAGGTIHVDDRIVISVDGLAAPADVWSQELVVDNAGIVNLPYAGAVRIASLTEWEASRAVRDAYRDLGVDIFGEWPIVSVPRLPR